MTIAARRCRPIAFALAVAAAPSAQEGVPAPPGLVPEKVWPAPTAADWEKPVLIRWQRTWEDAVALAKEQQRPILCCINMDGEIASEHYAGVRYRSADIAPLYEPYVCVVASVYRHNARDYDERGRRIPCPRFHGVTCGEHIAIEPVLYEKFMDGKRIAPRHIMVELDGKETYDVFYTWDTDSVFQTIQDGISKRSIQSLPVVRGDRPLLERVGSRDSQDRDAVERAFQDGDAPLRRAVLDAAAGLSAQAPIEVLRLAAAGFDLDLAAAARAALTKATEPGAVDLVAETLRLPLGQDERKRLVEALGALGATSSKAKMLATVHRGLEGGGSALPVADWSAAVAGATYAPASSRDAVIERAAAGDTLLQREPQSSAAHLDFAVATVEQALAETAQGSRPRATERYLRVLLDDAQHNAKKAADLGAADWRLDAVLAVCAQLSGDVDTARTRAVAAAAAMPTSAPGRLAAAVLALFAQARQQAISEAVRDKRDWPPTWMADVHAAYSVLARHPFGTDAQVADHWDFQEFFATAQATAVLDEGLRRFPGSALLHERLRASILTRRDADALESVYAERLQAEPSPALSWFAGYATLVAAEVRRRGGQGPAALATYDRGIALFERSCEATPDHEASAAHYVAMAHAGKARVLLQQGELLPALDALAASFARAPSAAATRDGLNLSAVDTARMLRARLVEQHQDAAVQRLDQQLAALDPAMLELPDYEREGRPAGRPRRRGR